MQDFSLAFARVSRSTLVPNPDLKSYVTELLARAYFNIHGQNITSANQSWGASLSAACMQLCLDARVSSLSTREVVHLFENVIRISEEHLREARRHAAMASNVFYLKETALDAVAVSTAEATYHAVATTIFGGRSAAHSGRLEAAKPSEPVA
jgi:hypothetical protein